ncbi:MAG: CARDB domain-containing protein [Bacteroidota bacterium]
MKKTIFFSLVMIFLIGQLNCSKECSSVLPDLIVAFKIDGLQTVVVGQALTIPISISNIANTVEHCDGDALETATAEASQSSFQIDFDRDEDGSFGQNELSTCFDIAPIPAGETAVETYVFSFDQPGIYRLVAMVDKSNVVDESNEFNNTTPTTTFDSGGRFSADQEFALVLSVLVKPEHHRPEEAPLVRLLSRSIDYSWK